MNVVAADFQYFFFCFILFIYFLNCLTDCETSETVFARILMREEKKDLGIFLKLKIVKARKREFAPHREYSECLKKTAVSLLLLLVNQRRRKNHQNVRLLGHGVLVGE